MDWIKFTDTARSFHVRVTISPNGYLAFTQGAVRQFGLKPYGFIVLYFSPSMRKIAIEPVTEGGQPGAKKIRFRGGGADVAIRPFLDAHGIRPKETMRFDVARDEETGWLVIDLLTGVKRNVSAQEAELDAEIGNEN